MLLDLRFNFSLTFDLKPVVQDKSHHPIPPAYLHKLLLLVSDPPIDLTLTKNLSCKTSPNKDCRLMTHALWRSPFLLASNPPMAIKSKLVVNDESPTGAVTNVTCILCSRFHNLIHIWARTCCSIKVPPSSCAWCVQYIYIIYSLVSAPTM